MEGLKTKFEKVEMDNLKRRFDSFLTARQAVLVCANCGFHGEMLKKKTGTLTLSTLEGNRAQMKIPPLPYRFTCLVC